jgi:Stabilization of polarity axis/Transport protein Avl9
MSDWFHAICIVDFDIGVGQVLEHVYPQSAHLTEAERSNICYCAFPDSNSGCMGDTKFHIALRTNSSITAPHRVYNRECQPHLKADVGHYWGYVFFRQVKDATSKRGYFQKSFVLITRLPFHNFFYELIQRWAPAYFASGISALEQGCEQIATWPRITANTQLQLHILGSIYQIYIPAALNRTGSEVTAIEAEDLTNNNSTPGSIPISITSPNEIDIFGPLHTIIHHIQLMWELMLLCEPLVIIATSPTDSSHIVQALTGLIHPLEYYAEVYPYFTIHNTEFREFAGATAPPAVILGVTNPYFAKTLQTWPHTVRISEPLQINHNSENPVPHRKLERVSLQKFLLDSSGSIYTQHKPFLQKDKSLVKKILNGVKTRRPSAVQSVILRRYFLELTQSFMIPLERYMSTLMPLAKDISAFRAPPVPSQFKEDTFLGTLELSGPHLTSTVKGDYEGLYKRFFRSSNFRGWYESRRMEQLEKLETLHQETLAKENLSKWIVGKQEVEIVDLIMCIKQKLQMPVTSNSTLSPPEPAIHVTIKKDVKDQLLKQLDELMNCLPDDLKTILN